MSFTDGRQSITPLSPFCQLCGVQFNIGRLRTPLEPAHKGYGFSSTDGESAITNCGETEASCARSHNRDPMTKEHVAIPGGQYRRGYNGYNITKEEMKHVTQVQCLLSKQWFPHVAAWTKMNGNKGFHDFELEAECFVSGVSRLPPTVHGNGIGSASPIQLAVSCVDGFAPSRFGIAASWVTNDMRNERQYGGFGIPFHPACFEIFKKVSQAKLGKVDLDGLYWLSRDSSDRNEEFPAINLQRGNDVEACMALWKSNWLHVFGTEYLVADPIAIPGLNKLLLNAAIATEDDNSIISSNLNSSYHAFPSNDPFYCLPQELLDIIVGSLPPTSILSLRLSSRCFASIPSQYFENLLRTEMAYMWEVFDNGGQLLNEGLKKALVERQMRDSATKTEENGAFIDWFKLYKTLKCRLIPAIKGLRNRKRIWRDIEKIVGMIEKRW